MAGLLWFLFFSLLFAIGFLTALIFFLRKETFISSITSVKNDPIARFHNTSYYELDNLAFETALRNTLASQGECPSYSPTQQTQTVTDDMPSNVNIAFTRALASFTDRIKNSTHFDLPGDIAKFAQEDPIRARPAFQVLAPQLTEYQLHISEVLVHIECVLYREAKYAGKHVEVWAHVDGSNITFPVANVLGVVFEDQLPTTTRGYEGQEQSPV
jgi:hypothetical protein